MNFYNIIALTGLLNILFAGIYSNPLDYDDGQPINVFVNKWTSTKTQLPYDHYSFPVCSPDKIEVMEENIGQILSGDKIENSLYSIEMNKNVGCRVLCKKPYKSRDLKALTQYIQNKYRGNILIDDLPVAEKLTSQEKVSDDQFIYVKGYPIGKVNEIHQYIIYNHLSFKLKYHQPQEGSYRVVGVEVEPRSINHKDDADSTSCKTDTVITGGEDIEVLKIGENRQDITYSYSVNWVEDVKIPWASRWDIYLGNQPKEIHLLTLGNSIIIGFFLTFLVALILIRIVYRDISRYNEILPLKETREEELEESGWKLVHSDVFRPPYKYPMLLSSIVGSGLQLLCMAVIVLFIFFAANLNKAARGSLLTATLLIFVLQGSVAGYFSGRLYKYFKGENWKAATFLTSAFFPGIIFSIGSIVNLFCWNAKSSRALSFTSIFMLLLLWIGISAPLVFIGAFYGFKKPAYEVPCSVGDIPREIPTGHWVLNPFISLLLSGIIPFFATYLEVNTIMKSIWLQQGFAIASILFMVFLITIISIAEISILMCYFQLINEDYNWWWRSILTGGSIGLYIFIYSIIYSSSLEMEKITTYAIYYGSMSMLCSLISIMGGAISFYSCFWFNIKIYGSIKVD